ncbi:MAG: phage major capsid protein [Ruminococcus sp.]|nr:phage major capsid protein [Ruminococcus sp.]
MRDKIKAMLDAKNARIDELRARNEAAQTVEELRGIEAETAAVIEERNGLQEMYENFDAPATTENRTKMEVAKTMENTTVNTVNAAEERAQAFAASHKMTIDNKEARAAVLVSGGSIAQPVGVSGINGLYPQVSSIVDMVKIVDASNMGGGYKIAYQITDAAAAAHTEGGDIAESEPTFGVLNITAEDVALVSYISNKVRRQSPLTYEQKVRDSAMTALRQYASKKIVAALTASAITETVEINHLATL